VSTASPDKREPRPGPPPPNVAFLTMAVGRRVRARVDAALAEHGLTYRHLAALGHLAGNGDLSYAELARRSGVTTQSMQATLAQLQERGAVEQRNEARRGLRAQLRVTPAGRDLLQLGTAAMQSIEQALLAPLPVEHQRVLGPALMAVLTGMLSEDTPVGRSEGPRGGAGLSEVRSTGE
jgi:DNA-binding MarR family transcriptional regulator